MNLNMKPFHDDVPIMSKLLPAKEFGVAVGRNPSDFIF